MAHIEGKARKVRQTYGGTFFTSFYKIFSRFPMMRHTGFEPATGYDRLPILFNDAYRLAPPTGAPETAETSALFRLRRTAEPKTPVLQS